MSGLVALVTGSGQGMGLGIVRALATQGAKVVINDLYEDRANEAVRMLQSEGLLDVCSAPGDITNAQTRKEIVEHAKKTFGRIDILVNNAGVPPGMPESLRPFQELNDDDFENQLNLNLRAVTGLVREVLPDMQKNNFGRIVIISSESWRKGLPFGLTNYAAAKSAALGFMRHLAHEVGRQGITANAVSLGTMNNFGDYEEYAKATAVGRTGTPEDVGAAVTYLASREASWMSGQVIPLNGGSLTV